MATVTATTGTDNFSGTGTAGNTSSTADSIVFSDPGVIQAADTFNGAGGVDTISVNGTATYASFDFSVMAAGPNFVEALAITGLTDVVFRANQFGAGLMSASLVLSGDNSYRQRLFINDATTFSASGWTISNWGFSDRIVITAANGVNALITGSAFHDSLIGGTGNDTLGGGAGNDTLTGGAGNDSLDGSTGADSIEGGSGNDTIVHNYSSDLTWDTVIDGGDGVDFARIAFNSLSTNVAFGVGDEVFLETLVVRNIEQVSIDGGSGRDSLQGGKLQDTLRGFTGNDSLVGLGGSDVLSGDGGHDWLSGGGSDDLMTGGTENDTLLGDDGSDVMDGSDGDDSLVGGAGSDTLTGSNGVDTLLGGDGRDWIVASSNLSGINDARIDGGAGTDYAIISKSFSTTGLAFSLATPDVAQTVDGTVIVSIEHVDFAGGSGNDTLTGGLFNDRLTGNAGNDVLDGADGNDSLSGNAGNDFLTGGLGNDTISESAGVNTIEGGEGNDSLSGGSDNDLIDGGAGDDSILGGQGDDTLSGGSGNDTIRGDAGADSIMAGDGDDAIFAIGATLYKLIDGGSGSDFAQIDVGTSVTALTLSLADPSVTQNLGTTVVANVEQVNLTTGAGNDTLTGGALNDTIQALGGDDSVAGGDGNDSLDGGAGNDRVSGDEGNDTLFGGSTGNDTLLGGGGDDNIRVDSGTASLAGGDGNDSITVNASAVGTVDGGDGTDVLFLNPSSIATPRTFSLASQGVAQSGLTVSNVELLNFTGGSGNDVVTGGDLADTLNGGQGDDRLFGGLGHDSMIGGNGSDRLEGGDGNDTLVTGTGSDIVLGGDGDDSIDARGDLIGSTAITIDGGAGIDYLAYTRLNSSSNLVFTLATPATAQTFAINTLSNTTIVNVERAWFVAGSGSDTLTGGALDDTLDGGGGNDSLTGGDGNDSLIGGAGVDHLLGGDGDDVLNAQGSAIDALIDGGAGNDIGIIAKTNSTTSLTFSFADHATTQTVDGTQIVNIESGNFQGGSGNDVLTGGTGNDTLSGNGGNDSLSGGDGNDYLAGNLGIDTLLGGAGNDTLELIQVSAGESIDGGDGIDRAIMYFDLGTTQGVFSLLDTSASQVVGGVTISNIERVDIWFQSSGAGSSIIGGAYDDTIAGTGTGGIYLEGGDGSDSIIGGSGNDTIVATGNSAGVKDAFLDGGSGFEDLLIIDKSNATVALNYNGTSASTQVLDVTQVNRFEQVNFTGGSGNDSLSGGIISDTLNGGAGDDTLSGNTGDDIIIGSIGNDSLRGDLGDDVLDYSSLSGVTFTYNLVDSTVSKGALGTDTISGFETINFGGNIVNFITGDSDESLGGGAVSDVMNGGVGNDTLDAGAGNDFLAGGAGNDSLLGNDGDDMLYADAGEDVMDGGAGNDTVNYNGQTGPITATFGATAGEATVSGSGFADLLIGIEGLVGTAAADTIIGGSSSVTVTGGGGNDSITGSSADDLFIIGVVDGTDIIDGSGGTDTIRARTANTAVNWSSTSNVEVFDSAGFANFRIKGTTSADTIDLSGLTLTGVERVDGGAGADSITSSAGNDRLFGGAGNDSMDGGDGDDTFLIAFGNGTDSIIGGTGSDTIRTEGNSITIDWTRVSGVEAADGGAFANFRLAGTASANLLDFSSVTLTGVERIDGGGGNDSITGSSGDDRIMGNSGADVLAGGAGADTFLYTLVTQSNAAATDRITDWDAADLIDLSAIDASTLAAGNQAFTWIGSGAFTKAAGQLRAFDDGTNTFVQADTNGDGKADMVIRIDGLQVLTAADFSL